MKRPAKRTLKIGLILLLPCCLYAVVAERLSWRPITLPTQADDIQDMAFLPGSNLMALATTSRQWPYVAVEIWDVASRQKQHTLWEAFGPIAVAPANHLLATTIQDNNNAYVALWNSRTWRQLHVFRESPSYGTEGLAFSPGEKLLAADNGTESIQIYDAFTYRMVRTVKAAELIGFSADGRFTAAKTVQQAPLQEDMAVITLWDTATWRRVHTLRIANENEWKPALSPDGACWRWEPINPNPLTPGWCAFMISVAAIS